MITIMLINSLGQKHYLDTLYFVMYDTIRELAK